MGAFRARAGFVFLAAALCAAAKDGPGYRIETVAGGAGDGDGGPAIQAQISPIQGIALDPAGNLYISDTDSHRVRRVDRYGIISTVAGTGEPGFGGDGAPAGSARLNLPYGLAVDGPGTLYIADLGNNRVRRVSPDTRSVRSPIRLSSAIASFDAARGTSATATIASGLPSIVATRGVFPAAS
jgi:hypothetical protein